MLCYTTVGVAEDKVVVGHKLFELDRPSLCSCHVCHQGSCLMLRKLLYSLFLPFRPVVMLKCKLTLPVCCFHM